jgi:glutamate synthase domain-containing protein 2
LHGSGEGGLTAYHDQGGDLVWQIGTGYFGCRDASGNFDLGRFLENVDRFPVKAIEVKLSQGAKPGLGGLLPGKKVTPEIAVIRGIPVGEDCHSPPGSSSFHDVDSMLDFVELLASETGLPVGIKSAVGEIEFWEGLADQMVSGDRGVDFIIIDGAKAEPERGRLPSPTMSPCHSSTPSRESTTSSCSAALPIGSCGLVAAG